MGRVLGVRTFQRARTHQQTSYFYLSHCLLQSGSCAVESSGTEDRTSVRNRLIGVAYAATWGHMIPRPMLPPRTMFEYLALPQLGSVLMSAAVLPLTGIQVMVACTT